LNMGAISFGVNPAIPQPISITRNFNSGCVLAKVINSSTGFTGFFYCNEKCIRFYSRECKWKMDIEE
jgi:hypothetical protein